jgi:hypothetical protein
MAPRITVQEARAWAERTKLDVDTLDPDLVDQVESQVMARLESQIDEATTWDDTATTPKIVRSVIAMLYVAWFYDRQYSEEQEELNDYAALLRAQAELLMIGILDGSIGVGIPTEPGQPAFYPTDESSALRPTRLDSSLGPAAFSMGTKF